MRIAIISDIHSNIQAVEAVKDQIDKSGSEMVICAGDVVGYGASPNECCAIAGDWVRHVCLGNHDLAALRRDPSGMNPYAAKAAVWTADALDEPSRAYLGRVSENVRFMSDGLQFAVHHGSLKSIWEYLFVEDIKEELLDEDRAQVLVFGHTHVPYVKAYPGGAIVNPGSVGQPRDGDPRASFAILDIPSLRCEIIRVEYDLDGAAESIRGAGLPEMLADRLHRGY